MSAARRSTRSKVAVAGLTSAAALAVFAVPAMSQDAASDIHVVHGIPGVTVDVYVDGELTLEDFEPNTRTDAVPLPPGNYNVDVVPADGDPDTDQVIDQTVVVPDSGLDLDLVAHYAADGTPQLSAFPNDLSRTGNGDARLTVRHTAEAPAVDVLAGGDAIVSGLENPDEASLEVPAGTYDVDVTPAGDADTVAIDVGEVDLAAGSQLVVYAVGSLGDDLTVFPFAVEVGEANFSRLAGKTRVETATAISERAFPDGSDVVYLANGFTLVDAVAGGTLTDGPVLVVPQCGDLPTHVGEEIERLGASEVIALGGAAALCDDILEEAAAIAEG